eukprot:TRINITY_DN1001_c0_g1_i1.p1 TRINITY_DN1001_c0_g1~~TRINITY_DN1001_c0_g1_i1.p1  ORF type:complete len:403 (-),score=164.10 TRINITY_DN1001_c0_g1_i1:85-1293(-)
MQKKIAFVLCLYFIFIINSFALSLNTNSFIQQCPELEEFTKNYNNEKPILRFRNDGTFKVMQIADLHYGEGEDTDWGPIQDSNSTRAIKAVLAFEKPDLVIYTGDQITGNDIKKNATAYWSQLVQPCVEAGINWAVVFGNHDDAPYFYLEDSEKRLVKPKTRSESSNKDQNQIKNKKSITTRSELMDFDMSYNLSLSQKGPSDLHGVSNYFLPILHSKTFLNKQKQQQQQISESQSDFDQLATIFYILDSGGGRIEEALHIDQVNWYTNVSQTITTCAARTVASLSFIHIPLLDYSDVYNPDLCFGMDDDGVFTVNYDSHLLNAFQKNADVLGLFVGHDHGNNWCCEKQDVQLCYGRHTGYGGYGDWPRGARVIQLTENNLSWTWKTWIRMENGTIIDQHNF